MHAPRWGALVALLPTPSAAQRAPDPPTARTAYDFVQSERAAAESLWSVGDDAGIERLHRVLAWLDRAEVAELFGDAYLAYRPLNVWNDLTAAYWLRGDTAAALGALHQAALLNLTPSFIALDSNLSGVAALPAAATSRQIATMYDRLWRDSVFVSPFRDSLPLDERLAGLALLWAEVRYGFVQFHQNPDLDWDRTFVEFLPRVRAAVTTNEYYQVLEEMIARVGDGHTNVYYPPELAEARYARPPIRTRLIEDSVVVTDVLSPSVEALGVRVGDVIERVGGLAVSEYAATRVRPYASASTPQDLDVRTYDYGLLRGPADAPVTITIRHPDGQRSELRVNRSRYPDVRRRPLVSDSVLVGNVGYLRVDDFASDSVPHLLQRAMSRMARTRALIVDVRRNGGGNTSYGFPILRAIASEAFALSRQRIRLYSAYYRAAAGIRPWLVDLPPVTIEPDTQRAYHAKVVLLIGPATYSAAEDFALAWRTIGRGPLVGERTGGSSGQPFFFPLPGHGRARVRTKWDSSPDGTEFNAVGVEPDILAAPTIAGVRMGRDEVLEAALRFLSTGG